MPLGHVYRTPSCRYMVNVTKPKIAPVRCAPTPKNGTAALALAVALFVWGVGSVSHAQNEPEFDGTFLVADQIHYDRANDTIEAHGNVEVLFDGLRLRAPSVVYDGLNDRVSVAGPIVLFDEASGSTTFGDFAELSTDMQNFVIAAARHLLADELQVAAAQMERREGRYTEWSRVVTSYCQVCETRPTPLWELRARRATHDQIKRRIYLQNAQFRVAGVPLAYAPYLSLPDPTVDRATGFVRASVRSNSATGTTLRLPYFIVLGDHADLTLTPGITIAGNANPLNTIEGRFRRAFAYGDLEVNAAISRDDLTSARGRGYLFANGGFAYPSGWNITFQLQTTSDRQYLQNYNFFNGQTQTYTGEVLNFATSTLISNLTVSRIRPDEIIQFSGTHLDTLQPPTTTTDHPSRTIDAEYARWLTIDGLPGQFLVNTVLQSDDNEFGPGNARQRDVARAFAGLGWRQSWALEGGFFLDAELAAISDTYRYRDDRTLPASELSGVTLGALTLRRPFAWTGQSGIRHEFEPYLRQLSFDGDAVQVPATDGTIDNFDPNGRFGLNRYRRFDRSRDITLSEVGASYMAHFTNGWSLGGRVEQDQFWNAAPGAFAGGRLYTANAAYRNGGLSLSFARAFTSDFLVVSDTATLRHAWQSGVVDVAYTHIGIDPVLSTTSATNLFSANARIDLNEALTLRSGITRDMETTDASFASAGIDFASAMNWQASLATNYSIDDAEYDTQSLSIKHQTNWGGNFDLFYNFDREEQRAVGVNFDYTNECMMFESQILRRRSVIDDAESAVELSLSVEFGNFDGGSGRSCR